MVNSRKIEDLQLIVAAKCRAFIAACAAAGIDVVITSTYRDAESQNALYAQGRTTPGKKVTNVRGGEACTITAGPLISSQW
ncbi:MAG: M15 family metallopeptidase [Burkholderiales bacterium]|nr:M15 family metallopeptidase [Burkholderiales bacterium]